MNEHQPTELERTFSRQLDGELSAAEQSKLYRDMLRDPVTREGMDTYESIDRRAHEALQALLAPEDDDAFDVERFIESLPPLRRRSAVMQWLWHYSGAVAAVLVLTSALLFSFYLHERHGNEIAELRDGQRDPAAVKGVAPRREEPVIDVLPAVGGAVDAEPDYETLIDRPAPMMFDRTHQGKRQVDEGVYGVYDDETGRFYLFRLKRDQTTIQPKSEDL